jgi:hypothetical protein
VDRSDPEDQWDLSRRAILVRLARRLAPWDLPDPSRPANPWDRLDQWGRLDRWGPQARWNPEDRLLLHLWILEHRSGL